MKRICIKCGAISKDKCTCKKPSVIKISGKTRNIKVEVTQKISCEIPVEILNLNKTEASFLIQKHLSNFTNRKLKQHIKYSKPLKRKNK